MTTTIHHSTVARAHDRVMDTLTPTPRSSPIGPRPTRRFPAAYKARILEEYDRLGKATRAPCCAAKACTRRCFLSGASNAIAAAWSSWPSRRGVRPPTRATRRSEGSGATTSA